MIVHPSRDVHSLVTIPGTRVLREDFNLIGHRLNDARVDGGAWIITNVYAPLNGRRPKGIRAKLENPKTGTVTFIEQIYLEVALGLQRAGTYCAWAAMEYPSPGTPTFHAMVCDEDDLTDDLYDREVLLRDGPEPLELGTQMERHIQPEPGLELTEVLVLVSDQRDDGSSPDLRFTTVERRWRRVEKKKR